MGHLLSRFPRGVGTLHPGGYLAVLAFLCAAGGAAIVGIRAVSDHDTHTVDVTDALNAAVLDQIRVLDDQETSLRGYLLTGQASYLQPYNAAAGKIPALRGHALTLAHDEPRAESLLTAMVDDADRWQSWATQVVTSPRLRGAALLTQQSIGKGLFDRQRASAARMASLLNATRLSAHGQSETILSQARWVVAIPMLIAAIGIALVSLFVTRAVSLPLRSLGRAARWVGERLHRAEVFEGIGVGLAIVQRITVAGSLGKGATFTVRIPSGPAQQGRRGKRSSGCAGGIEQGEREKTLDEGMNSDFGETAGHDSCSGRRSHDPGVHHRGASG